MSKLLGSPVRAQPEAPEAQPGSSGQPGLPTSQQPGQHLKPTIVAAPEPSSSGAVSAPQPVTQAPAAEEQASEVQQAPADVPGPQAPIRLRVEPQQPVSPLPVGRMTQVFAPTVCHLLVLICSGEVL